MKGKVDSGPREIVTYVIRTSETQTWWLLLLRYSDSWWLLLRYSDSWWLLVVM